MAKRKPQRPVVERSTIASRANVLARPFLPSLDLVDGNAGQFEQLEPDDKQRVLLTKVADATHFRVGLARLHRHALLARELAADVRPLPREVRGVALNPNGDAAVRVSVQPRLAVGRRGLRRTGVTARPGVAS